MCYQTNVFVFDFLDSDKWIIPDTVIFFLLLIYSIAHSFNRYFLSVYHLPGIGNTAANKTCEICALMEITFY